GRSQVRKLPMAEAFIIDALRTPTGKRRGSLAPMHGADLGAQAIKTLGPRKKTPAEDYDDVIFGCLDAIGPLAGNIARTCWLAAGLPLHVPGGTVAPQGGSPQPGGPFSRPAGV